MRKITIPKALNIWNKYIGEEVKQNIYVVILLI
jgi:hypothetical protein